MTKRNAKIVGAVFVVCGALPLAAGLAAGRSEKVWAPWDPPNDANANAGDFQSDPPQTPIATEARPRGLAVCVRLCDGSFFPSAASSGGDEACVAQCPDAPTALYFERAGSDRIEDAVSAHGAPYSALPTAGRFRTTLDANCRRRRSPTRDDLSAILTDPTLRKGDIVMTPKGPVVFQGAKAGAKTASDFVALSQARSLPKDLQTSVSSMRVADPAL